MSKLSLSISFLGDISLNSSYKELYSKGLKPFNQISKKLEDSIVVGNFECFAEGKDGFNPLKIPRLETNLETLNFVKDFHLQIACLANNHVYDNLEDGFGKTIQFLEKSNIRYFGASLDNAEQNEPLIIEENGIKIALLNYVTTDTNPNPPEGIKINLNYFNVESVINDINKIKGSVNHIVLYLHWGGRVEGGFYPDFDQPQIARRLVDAGADLIIGHHSHTLQPYEKYKGKYIFYSLGNFCFADVYHENKLHSKLSKRLKRSVILDIDFNKDSYDINIIPIKNSDGFIELRNKSWALLSLNFRNLNFQLLKRSKLLWKVYFLKLKKVNPIFNYFFVQGGSVNAAFSVQKIRKHLLKK